MLVQGLNEPIRHGIVQKLGERACKNAMKKGEIGESACRRRRLPDAKLRAQDVSEVMMYLQRNVNRANEIWSVHVLSGAEREWVGAGVRGGYEFKYRSYRRATANQLSEICKLACMPPQRARYVYPPSRRLELASYVPCRPYHPSDLRLIGSVPSACDG
jgi:hypothetical protein